MGVVMGVVMPEGKATVDDVVAYMLTLFDDWGELEQDRAAAAVHARFGDEFARLNERGRLRISQAVYDRFEKATPDKVWDPRGLKWLPRPPGVVGRRLKRDQY
jgi:hypothetical protein